jgi:hypothetical protein
MVSAGMKDVKPVMLFIQLAFFLLFGDKYMDKCKECENMKRYFPNNKLPPWYLCTHDYDRGLVSFRIFRKDKNGKEYWCYNWEER